MWLTNFLHYSNHLVLGLVVPVSSFFLLYLIYSLTWASSTWSTSIQVCLENDFFSIVTLPSDDAQITVQFIGNTWKITAFRYWVSLRWIHSSFFPSTILAEFSFKTGFQRPQSLFDDWPRMAQISVVYRNTVNTKSFCSHSMVCLLPYANQPRYSIFGM